MFAKLIEDMQQRVRQELQKEKRDREATEETLIRLLEETCARVENSLGYKQ